MNPLLYAKILSFFQLWVCH